MELLFASDVHPLYSMTTPKMSWNSVSVIPEMADPANLSIKAPASDRTGDEQIKYSAGSASSLRTLLGGLHLKRVVFDLTYG